jgi:hypothetical protein
MSYEDPAAKARRKLLAEIEDTLRSASTQTRSRIFIRITDLFLQYAGALDEDVTALFGEVFLRQTGGVDTDVLAEASARLAPIANAPPRMIRMLSRHGVAAVAAPVLARSPMLTMAELVAIAGISSPDHLLAIAQRAVLDEQVTQVLVELGNQPVMNQLATNPGVRYTIADFGTMLGRAAADDRARVITRMPVKVLRLGGGVAGECIMTDISPGGAKLNFETPASVPEMFTLEFSAVERKQIQSRVVWRRGAMLGSRFTASLIALWDPDAAQAAAATSVSA